MSQRRLLLRLPMDRAETKIATALARGGLEQFGFISPSLGGGVREITYAEPVRRELSRPAVVVRLVSSGDRTEVQWTLRSVTNVGRPITWMIVQLISAGACRVFFKTLGYPKIGLAVFGLMLAGFAGSLVQSLLKNRKLKEKRLERIDRAILDELGDLAIAGTGQADAQHGLLSVPSEASVSDGQLSLPEAPEGALSSAEIDGTK